ncbi:MAG: FG-GAP repeat protein [Anaerolineales bacterium]|nr:FG-GAP repeat protein [Anaerolineales bacterium]
MKTITLSQPLFHKLCAFALAILLALGNPSWLPLTARAEQTSEKEAQSIAPAGWLSQAQETIRQSEYQISWVEEPLIPGAPPSYQAPNRAQDLRFYFQKQGLQVIQRETSQPAWSWGLRLAGVGSPDQRFAPAAPALQVEANRVVYFWDELMESYTNTELGLQQEFTLQARPELAEGAALALELALSGALAPRRTASGGLEFTHDRQTVLRYGNLRAVDAAGRSLRVQAQLLVQEESSGCSLLLEVADQEASYPLQISASITGLAPSSIWYRRGNQEAAWLGYSVATAGDVNGDGYSDIIIGAPFYDGGVTNDGMAYVFLGTSLGPVGSPSWSTVGEYAENFYGGAVATAGDVNGDGYSDVIVGAAFYDNHSQEINEGKVYVYHGSPGGLSTTAAWSYEGNQTDANLGWSAATAGDVNGDNFSDVVVGAPLYNAPTNNEGRALVFHGSGSGLQASPAFTRDGAGEQYRLGIEVATAGDVNADGCADVLISEQGASSMGYTGNGQVRLYYGSSGGLSAGGLTTLSGYTDYEEYGESVSTAGDVNGDGYADVIIGSHLNADNYGAAYLYYGSNLGLATTTAWHVEGGAVNDFLGASVATGGDINGDGYGDILVGWPNYDGGLNNQGRTMMWWGGSSGLRSNPYYTPESANWYTDGGVNQSGYGSSTATAGDTNGDGFSDVIIGAFGYTSSYTQEGCAFVYLGGPDNLSISADWSRQAAAEAESFGYSVASAGDVNGDGYADIIIGSPSYDGGYEEQGAIYVWHGSASGLSAEPNWSATSGQAYASLGVSVDTAGDINGDGYDDIIAGAPHYSNPTVGEGMAFVWLGGVSGLGPTGNPANADWKAESNQSNAQLGSAVADAGDINGDGYADIAVGVHYYTNDQISEGLALVWFGGPDGLGVDGNPSNAHDSYELNYEYYRLGESIAGAGDINRDGYSDLIIGGTGVVVVLYGSPEGLGSTNWIVFDVNAHIGASVDTAGDINGDGYSDVIIGAPWYSGLGVTNEGAAYAYCGSSSGLGLSHCWENYGGLENAQYGFSVATAGDVNGDGYADILVGAWKYTAMETEEGNARLYYGSASGPTSCGGTDCTADWWFESDSTYARLGTSVASAGDVNGDGYADVLLGAPNLQTSGYGKAYLFYGNGTPGKPVRPRQIQLGYANIARLGLSNTRSFMMQAFAYSPTGRGDFKLQHEVDLLPNLFDGLGAVTAGAWGDTNLGGTATVGVYSNLDYGKLHHWRIRLKYNLVTNPFNPPYSRWYHMPWNGWNEADLRGMFYNVYIPLTRK